MIRKLTITLLLLQSAMTAHAFSSSFNLPKSLSVDTDLIEIYWQWLKVETTAPADTPIPDIVIEDLPSNAKMALFYPTQFKPDEALRITISERAIERAKAGDRLLVLSELAHELVHYILLMQEHKWAFSRYRFDIARHGHCDPEFQRLSKEIGQVIWQAYHSDALLRDVAQMVQKACWENGHVLSAPGGY